LKRLNLIGIERIIGTKKAPEGGLYTPAVIGFPSHYGALALQCRAVNSNKAY